MDNTTHISIDLETLALDRDAVILAIAIVTDDGSELLVHPSIDEQIAEGRKIDGETLRWWLRQGNAARQALTQGKTVPLDEARRIIENFLMDYLDDRPYLIWGNAPSFDCDMLAHFLGYRPWFWHRERDIRTARMALPKRTQPDTAHSALDDAKAQLADVLRFARLAEMMEGGVMEGKVPAHE